MSLLSRIANVFRSERLAREIDEELQSHIDEAIENGRDPHEVRRAFGSRLATRDESRDIRLVSWLDSLRADVVFGWRQLSKSKVTSAAAIVSLGLAVGACMSAFRLVDAILLRPLPIDRPERLYSLVTQLASPTTGQPMTVSAVDYPLFRAMREDLRPEAELIAVSSSQNTDLSYESNLELEKAYLQYVSGGMFSDFGLGAELGRLLTEDDDKVPQGRPYAVLSFDYWQTRFAADPGVIGKTFTSDKRLYEIVGVVQRGFSGTETGTMTDIFVPITMNPFVDRSEIVWFMTLALIESNIEVQPQLARMQVLFSSQLQGREKDYRRGLSESQVEERLSRQLRLEPASAGASGMQRGYRQALVVLSALVALVLLIACANVANLMTARSSARAREMALRVAIGVGRRRLVQLVLVESVLITVGATLIAGLFSWWATPLIVSNLPGSSVRLALPFDWRLFQFSVALTLAVTIACGLTPALHASAVRPLAALKGGNDPHRHRSLMNGLIGAQVAFCAVVLFFAGLFVATLDRLANKPLGYSPERLLAVDAVAAQPHPAVIWDQVAGRLRTLPGFKTVSLADRPLRVDAVRLTNVSRNSAAAREEMALALNLDISAGWIDTMNVRLIRGRGLRADEAYRVALVNEKFAKAYFDGENPLGKSFNQGRSSPVEVVGLVGDFQDFRLREPVMPAFYTLIGSVNGNGEPSQFTRASYIVRTTDEDSLALAEAIRREIPEAHSDFSVSNITTQQDLNSSQLARERLIAMLASFFAAVALILSAVGIYGVLHYSVVQQRREIGVRIALGAQAANIALRVTKAMFVPVLLGSCLGLAIGVGLERYVADLLWNVEGTDPAMMAVPALALLAALFAAVPEVIRALRVDPTELLRTD